jgi:organic radical activating enzyme
MKLHHFDTVLTLGRHIGKTVAQVLENNPTYPEWCYDQIDDFYVTDAVWEALDLHKNLNDALKSNYIDNNETKDMIAKNKKFHEEKKENYKNHKMELYSKKIDKELSGGKNR